MPFIELSGRNVRNLHDYKFEPSKSINIFAGKNGAGKTNLLEAIYLNALGRSFRTSATRNLIADDSNGCWVFALYKNDTNQYDQQTGRASSVTRLGVERRKGNHQKLSIDGIHHTSLAKLALIAPVLAIQPSETNLIDGTASLRRKYLDWLLFHVEPDFLSVWRDNQRLLKQRNLLLRRFTKRTLGSSHYRELKSWDHRYIKTCELVSDLRHPLAESLEKTTTDFLKRLPAFVNSQTTFNVNKTYSRGWSEDKTLEEVLEEGLELDIKRGFTRSGAHRCDLVLKANGNNAKEYLSRGQKKLFAMTLRLAQAKELQRITGQKAVLLLDDLFAELDQENVLAFLLLVEELETQVFLTCLQTESKISESFISPTKLFHVEQGKIKLVLS